MIVLCWGQISARQGPHDSGSAPMVLSVHLGPMAHVLPAGHSHGAQSRRRKKVDVLNPWRNGAVIVATGCHPSVRQMMTHLSSAALAR